MFSRLNILFSRALRFTCAFNGLRRRADRRRLGLMPERK
jgi:hypothetical protein